MISKNGLTWFARSLMVASLMMGAAACGDDDVVNETPDAAQNPDAEECVGHTCTGNDPTMNLTEGGVSRFELFDLGDNQDGTPNELLAGWSFFFTNQTPASRGILGPAVTANITYPGDGTAYCYDQTAHNYFLSGKSVEGQAIVDTRDYYDVGQTLYVKAGDAQIDLTKAENEVDFTNQLQHKIIYNTNPDQAATLLRGMKYELQPIAPVGNFPGFDLKAGVDVPKLVGGLDPTQDETRPPAMYFPHDLAFTDSPTRDEFYAYNADNAGPGFIVDDSGDYSFKWTRDAGVTNPEGWAGQVQFVGFLNDQHTIEYLCVVGDPVEDGAVGELVVPQGLFTQPNFPTTGEVIFGSLTHIAWNLNEHRFDILGVNCKYTPKFTLASANQ